MESLRFRKRGGVRSYDDTLGEDTSGVADDMKEKRRGFCNTFGRGTKRWRWKRSRRFTRGCPRRDGRICSRATS